MHALRSLLFLLLIASSASVASGQAALTSRQLELYVGLADLPFPEIKPSQPFDQNTPDTILTYFMDPVQEQTAFFGFGYRRDWDNGRYLLFSVPRLVLGSRRSRQLSLSLLNDRRFIRQQFDYVSLRGEFGRRYHTQQPLSFLLGFAWEGVATQTKNTPDPTANSYFSRYRLLATQLALTAQVHWRMRDRWSLIAGIDPLTISGGIEQRYAENPTLDTRFWSSTTFDLDFLTANQLYIGLAYRWE